MIQANGQQVTEEDLGRVAAATGAQVQTTVNNLNPKVLGTCARFEEQQVELVAPHCQQTLAFRSKHCGPSKLAA